MAKTKAPVKPMTKSEIVSGIADSTGLTKKDVNSVLEAMAVQIKKSLGRKGPGAVSSGRHYAPGYTPLSGGTGLLLDPLHGKRHRGRPGAGCAALYHADPPSHHGRADAPVPG